LALLDDVASFDERTAIKRMRLVAHVVEGIPAKETALSAFVSPHSSLRQWLASLDRLEALELAIIVPSHGPTGDGTAFITGYRAYLMEVRDPTAVEKRAGATSTKRSKLSAPPSATGRLTRRD